MAGIICSVPFVWESLAAAVEDSGDWTGQFLSFLSNKVFRSARRPSEKDCFKMSRNWGAQKCLDCFAQAAATASKKNAILEQGYDVTQIHNLFNGMSGGYVETIEEEGHNIHSTVEPLLSEHTRCVIVTQSTNSLRIPCPLPLNVENDNGVVFEVCHISIAGSVAYSRHGHQFEGWWRMESLGKTARWNKDHGLPDQISQWNAAAYVNKTTVGFNQLQDDYLLCIGGQVKAMCSVHGLPLITSSAKNYRGDKLLCLTNNCNKPAHFCCPRRNGCCAHLCRLCFKDIRKWSQSAVTSLKKESGPHNAPLKPGAAPYTLGKNSGRDQHHQCLHSSHTNHHA